MKLYQRHIVKGKTPGPRLLVIAGVHGDECEPMVAVKQLNKSLPHHIVAGQVTLIPIANESAHERGSRVGEDGLDLARSFPGHDAGTVTESLAAELHREILGADYVIDLHTGGAKYEILPMCGYMLHADPKVLGAQRQMAHGFGLPYIWGTSAAAEGRTLSSARDAGIPAIYAEFGGGGQFNSAAVTRYVEGCERVMAWLGMLRPADDDRKAQFVCEDALDGSGHIQAYHPAPCQGKFIPDVALGDSVQTGQTLGVVHSSDSGQQHTIVADRDGIVLALYVESQVDQGFGLCVVVNFSSTSEV